LCILIRKEYIVNILYKEHETKDLLDGKRDSEYNRRDIPKYQK
jgi:hypothetical protein